MCSRSRLHALLQPGELRALVSAQGNVFVSHRRTMTGAKSIRDAWRRWRRRRLLHAQVQTRPLRIVLGSSGVDVSDWLLTDMDQLDITVENDWKRYFVPNSLEAILAEHVWEHLSPDQGASAARHCYSYLCPGGRLRVAMPDGRHPDPDYIDAVRPMGSAEGSDDHKVLYTCDSLNGLFEAAGFQTQVLECFDSRGQFVSVDWDPKDGMVRRSARFDPRNEDGVLRYTSIIIDALKPES